MSWLLLFVLLLVTGVLAAVEMATFSARPERMRQAMAAGDRRGSMVLVYQRSPSSFLASLQVITTLATLGLGILTQQYLFEPVNRWFADFDFLGSFRTNFADGFALVLATVVTLIFTNVLPKQVGFVRANEVALRASRPMWVWIRLMSPLSWIVAQFSKVLFVLLRVHPDERHRVTETDLRHLIREGNRSGSLDERESQIMQRAMSLSDVAATTAMTNRNLIDWIDASWSPDRISRFICGVPHAYLPVADGSLENIKGILSARDWLREDYPKLENMVLRPAPTASADSSLLELLTILAPIETKAVFLQDAGNRTVGMVTLNDAVQAITGPLQGA